MNKIDLIEFSQYDQQSQINNLVRKINEVIQNMPFTPKFSDGKSYDKMNRAFIPAEGTNTPEVVAEISMDKLYHTRRRETEGGELIESFEPGVVKHKKWYDNMTAIDRKKVQLADMIIPDMYDLDLGSNAYNLIQEIKELEAVNA